MRQNPQRVLSEFYATLIAAIVQHWIFIMANVHDLALSMFQAHHAVRNLAWGLMRELFNELGLYTLLYILRDLLRSCETISSPARLSNLNQLDP